MVQGAFLFFIERANAEPASPLEVVQSIATENGWSYQGIGDDEIVFLVRRGTPIIAYFLLGCDAAKFFILSTLLNWRCHSCVWRNCQRLVACINEQLWLGHFYDIVREFVQTHKSMSERWRISESGAGCGHRESLMER
jgi:hypothetical protein